MSGLYENYMNLKSLSGHLVVCSLARQILPLNGTERVEMDNKFSELQGELHDAIEQYHQLAKDRYVTWNWKDGVMDGVREVFKGDVE